MSIVAVSGKTSGLAQEIVADEPVAPGGTGLGPNPYDLLLTALGT